MAAARTFSTARLVAEYPDAKDDPAIVEAIQESHGELKPWLDWAQHVLERAEVEHHTRQAQAAFDAGERFLFNLFLKEPRDFACRLEIRPAPGWIQEITARGDWWELGYWCRSKYVGQGYMSEALTGAMQWALSQLGLAWFVIRMDSRNLRSQALAARLGFEKIHSRTADFLGQPRLEYVYQRRVLP